MIDVPKTYQCGTLTYTKASLAILFFWLLWGDVCYTLMESVTRPIMLLKFDRLGASNVEIGLILSTIPGIIYTILNPVVSFKSDRHRGKWGRRIPFILFSLPFLVMCLVIMAFGDRFGFWLHDRLAARARALAQWFFSHGWSFLSRVEITPSRAALWSIGGTLIAFTFFNTFVTSTFWYLFNDVVPERLLARFMSWFRMLAMLTSALYQFWIFRYSETHSTEIFIGAALLYLIGFGLMCLNVREGTYPPPSAYADGKSGPFAAITTYAKECHSLKHYWYQWIDTFIGAIGGGMGTFMLLFNTKAIGLTLAQVGYINGTTSLVISVLILGSGWLADRYHPIRVVAIGVVLTTFIVVPAGGIWIFWHPAPSATWELHLPFVQEAIHVQKSFLVAMSLNIGLAAPVAALVGVWDPPLFMRFFPRDRYGQFCSTNAIWRAGGGMLGGILAGGFLDVIGRWVGQDNAYFYIPVWNLAFAIPSVFLFFNVYRSWKRYGGDNYVPPLPVFGPLTTTDAIPVALESVAG